jgi:hypothetical protein
MADIFEFKPKVKQPENESLNRARAKLIELLEVREAINREIRYNRDVIKLLDKGE